MAKARWFAVMWAALVMLTALALAASAQNVRWNPDGTKTLTQDGWALAGSGSDGLTKSRDFSSGYIDGSDTVWRINDNNSPSNAYMRMYKDPGGMNSSRGLIIARIKYISGSTYPKGTFGYSSAGGEHSIVVSIRNGQANIKTCQGDSTTYNSGNSITVPGGTTSYRVYALRYYAGGVYDLWVSNGSDWSSNSSDWTQLISSGQWTVQSPMIDENGTMRTGLVLGSFGPDSESWNGYIDYIAWSANTNEQTPWSFNPSPAVADDSQYVSDTIPSTMTPGESYSVSITLKNAGTNTWTQAAGYQLGAVGDSDPFCAFNRVDLAGGDSIATNGQKTFTFTMTAPTTPGAYTTDWRMVKGSAWFGYTLTKQIQVLYPDTAQYVSDTIPTTMEAGHQYTVSVTMRNTSNNTWTQASEYKLGAVDDSDPFGPGRVDLGAGDSIGTNQTKTFTFTLTAPESGGTYTTDWRMVHEGICWFGDTLAKQVEVAGPPQRVVVDDPLTGPAALVGTRIPAACGPGTPGELLSGVGWRCNNKQDSIYYHMDTPISRGAAEFEIQGLRPNELEGSMNDKTELFHMYDYSYNNADCSYAPGYRDDTYKMYIRKIGLWSTSDPAPNADKFELVWQRVPASMEPDSNEKPAWDPATWYKFRMEWGPDGHGNTTMSITLNGSPITTTPSMWFPGFYTPGGHSVRIGASTRGDVGTSAPLHAIYRNVKVWQLTPIAPVVVRPVSGGTSSSRTPTIEWVGESHTQYEAHVCASGTTDPNSNVVWDSGVITSGTSQIMCGTLSDQTTYAVFIRIANAAGWSDWSPAGYSFRIGVGYASPRTGGVQVADHCLSDSGGTFLGLGATYMRAMQKCKYDRARFKRDCSFLSANGFNYIRILTMVGWDQLEIAPLDIPKDGWTLSAWSDYWQQFKDTIDIAYDNYGLRTEITIFADAQNCMPNEADRYTHMDRILSNLVGREHKVAMIEVANEYWQNGLTRDQLRAYGCYLSARTSIPIALSAPSSDSDIDPVYCSSCADITTIHFTREATTYEGGWLPVRAPWDYSTSHPCVAPMSSNEPIGPGYSIGASEDDPIKLCSAAVFAWIAKLPMYVYHSRPGVDGKIRSGYPRAGESISFEESPGVDAYRYLLQLLPSDLPNWARNDGKEASAPFTAYCNGQANKYWTDFGTTALPNGCHRNVGAKKGNQFVCYPEGILSGGVTLQARRWCSFTVYSPLTGAVVLGPVVKNAGDSFTLAQGPGAYIIVGDGNDPAPGPVTNFAASGTAMRVNLSWTNPTDSDLAGVKVLVKTGSYPSGPTDGTVIFNSMGTSCAHTGLSSGVSYYYAAYAYDAAGSFSVAATTSIPSPTTNCYVDDFSYPNGALNGNNGWAGTAAAEIAVENQSAKVLGGSANVQALKSVTCSGSGGVIWAEAKIKPGYGGGTLWGLWIDDAAGNNLARWYGSGTTARPRIGGTGLVLDPQTLNAGWNTIGVKINTNTDIDEYYLNGVSLGTLSHSSTGAGNSVGRVKFERSENSPGTDYIYFDDLVVGPPDVTAPDPVTNFKAKGGTSQVALSWTNPTTGDFAGTRIVAKTGSSPTSPTDGTLVYSGAATGCIHAGLTNGTKYFYSAYAYDGIPNYSVKADATAHAAADASILDAKGLLNNEVRALRGNVVSAKATGYFYVQDPAFYSGIKVVAPDTVSQGAKVDVVGILLGQGAERYLDCSGNVVVTTAAGPFALDPPGMGAGSVGGTALNVYAPGVVGGLGSSNIGLLVRIWGKVTQRDTAGLQYFYLDDGSGRKDGTQTAGVDNVGIRILANPTGYGASSYVAVTGVVSTFPSGGLRPQILPRAGGIAPL